MSRVYDSWEKLVGAVLKREELRRLALSESFSSSISADFSFDSCLQGVSADSGSLNETFYPATSTSRTHSFYRDVQPIEFKEIKKATRNFRVDMMMGMMGELGHIYKGWIDEHTLLASVPGSGTSIAVKNCNQDGLQGHREWLNEIIFLSLLHPNLLKLIGYCSEENNLVLVYEFMPKGSLDNHLFTRGHQPLCWATRIKVAIGAARGLSFLHDTEIPVIHRDFKTSNILLDGEFNAKLSNFSLARGVPTGDMTHVSTQVMGTYGYVAPEYLASGHLTTKCDAYSFGVVLLELLSGRQVLDTNLPMKEQNLVEWAKPYLGDKRKLLRIMDCRLFDQYPLDGARKVGKLASRCLSLDPKLRPTMAEVVVALEQL